MCVFTKILQRKIFMNMLLHMQDYIVNQIAFTRINHIEVFFVVDKQREVVIQTHAGESEIVDAISEFKCVIDGREKRDDVIVGLDMQRMKMLLYCGHRIEIG